MEDQSKQNTEDLLREAEVKKITVEIRKIEAEKLKIDLERQEIEHRLKLPFYNADNIQLTLKNEATRDSLNTAKVRFDKQLIAFQKEKAEEAARLVAQLKEIERKYIALDSIHNSLEKELRNQSNL